MPSSQAWEMDRGNRLTKGRAESPSFHMKHLTQWFLQVGPMETHQCEQLTWPRVEANEIFVLSLKKKKNSVRKTQKTLRLKDLSAQSQPIKTFRLSSVVQDPKGREWAVWGDMSYSSDALWNSRGNVSWVKTVCSSSLFLCAKVDNISSKLVWPKVSQYL